MEEDPKEILSTVKECIDKTVKKLRDQGVDPSAIKAIGVTNQRETTIVWDRTTGEPLHPAVGQLAANMYSVLFVQLIDTYCPQE